MRAREGFALAERERARVVGPERALGTELLGELMGQVALRRCEQEQPRDRRQIALDRRRVQTLAQLVRQAWLGRRVGHALQRLHRVGVIDEVRTGDDRRQCLHPLLRLTLPEGSHQRQDAHPRVSDDL
jgi:hypothetical protein